MNNEIHFFDLDGTLWNLDAKVWVISTDNPSVPLYKLDNVEFALIKNGVYKDENIQISYNDKDFWIPEKLYDYIRKKRKIEADSIGFSFREFFDMNYINKIILQLKTITHLKNKTIDIGLLSARYNQEGEQELLNILRLKLKDYNLDINKIFYIGERFQLDYSDDVIYHKTMILLEHLVGNKIEKNKFIPLKQDWYKTVYFYDDEVQNIYTANRIQKIYDDLMKNSSDEVFNIIKQKVLEFDLTLVTNLITDNELNKFKSTEIILRDSNKYPIKIENKNFKYIKLYEDFNSIKKLGHSDYKIGMVNNNPSTTYKSMLKYLSSINQEYNINLSNTTSSKYIDFTDKNDNYFKLRFANHTPALMYLDQHKGINIDFDFNYNTFTTTIDNSYGFKSNDIKNIINNLQTKYFDIINNTKLDYILSDFEYMYKTTDDIITNKIKTELNIVDDEYSSASAVIDSIIHAYKNFHYYDGYFEYVKEIRKQQDDALKQKKLKDEQDKKELEANNKLKTSEYEATNGIIIKTNNNKLSYLWEYDYSNLNLSGERNRNTRKRLIQAAYVELQNKIDNNEIH